MRILMATTSALLLTAGLAMAQSNGAASQPPAGQTQGEPTPETSPAEAGAASGGSTTSEAAVLVPIEEDNAPVPSLNLMVDQVEDMDVIGADDAEVGEVTEVFGDANGNAVAIGVDVGGFLGVGQRTVILMLDGLELEMGRLRTSLTQSEIEALPEFQG